MWRAHLRYLGGGIAGAVVRFPAIVIGLVYILGGVEEIKAGIAVRILGKMHAPRAVYASARHVGRPVLKDDPGACPAGTRARPAG